MTKRWKISLLSCISCSGVAFLCALSAPAWALTEVECVGKRIAQAPAEQSLAELRAECRAEIAGVPAVDHIYEDCLQERAATADDAQTIEQVRTQCSALAASGKTLPKKLVETRKEQANPYVIAALRQNYILPYTYNSHPQQVPNAAPGDDDLIQHEEMKLQISLRAPLTYTDLLTTNDGIYFGFTLKSFWQFYNDEISAPFRETNYRPEVFYQAPLLLALGDGAWIWRLGLEHESNGRSQTFSRSWNRVYTMFGYLDDRWGVSLQPWYRLPEDDKEDDGDPLTPPPAEGDDNPDIEDFMGHYELTGAYRWNDIEFSALLRRNFDEGRGAHEFGISFPLWGRLRGYFQYFEGYGESLIDYDHKNQRIGVGVLLTDML